MVEIQNNRECQFGKFTFHDQKVLIQFISFFVAMIVIPISMFFVVQEFLLKNYKSISEAHIQMISGGIAVFSVNLIMGFYAYLVANDPENFKYEQEQQRLSDQIKVKKPLTNYIEKNDTEVKQTKKIEIQKEQVFNNDLNKKPKVNSKQYDANNNDIKNEAEQKPQSIKQVNSQQKISPIIDQFQANNNDEKSKNSKTDMKQQQNSDKGESQIKKKQVNDKSNQPNDDNKENIVKIKKTKKTEKKQKKLQINKQDEDGFEFIGSKKEKTITYEQDDFIVVRKRNNKKQNEN